MDLRDRLQSPLGSAYVVERELGGGGMSRLFLAREVALERNVVRRATHWCFIDAAIQKTKQIPE